ncbi:MAG: pyruvate kinase [Planctomycetota bacterium]|jgi:pyruvate kinase
MDIDSESTSEEIPAPSMEAPDRRQPFTKIVATIGPATEDMVGELIDRGMTVARLNFSHGTAEDHRRRAIKIRAAAEERLLPVGILADLPGPKMRTGLFPEGSIDLVEREIVRLRSGSGLCIAGEVLIDVPDIAKSVQIGHRVFLADGQVELVVEDRYGDTLVGRVLRAGPVGNRKGVHLPDSDVAYDLPTDQDRELIKLGLEIGVDMFGVSFVSNAAELDEVRELSGNKVQLVAKIERKAALNNVQEILGACEGLMVARGDLGVEMALSQLPLAQKYLIEQAVRAGKYTITATEMLESMIQSSRPTRAEVTDVANAVLDGTDAVMLSAETAVGDHPLEAVATMASIALAVESSVRYVKRPRLKLDSEDANFYNATAMAAVHVANALSLKRIVCFTETGNTVRLISRFRPNSEILALSPSVDTVNRMAVLAHVRGILFSRETSLEDMLDKAVELLLTRGLAKMGEEVVFVAGVPPGVAKSTNVMKLHRIGEVVKFS